MISTQDQKPKIAPHSRDDRHIQVVGASVAGLFSACLLARAGRAVDVFERAEGLNPLPRTLIVTDRMRRLLGPIGESCITNEIRQFELFTDGRRIAFKLDRPDLVIERATLLHSLENAAKDAGAQFHFGCRFQSLANSSNNLSVQYEHCESGAREARDAGVVIGADGVASRVARAAGWPAQSTVPLIQAIVELPPDMSPDTVRVWFVPHDTPYFYWLIPRNQREGVLGLIGESGPEARVVLEQFLERKALTPIKFEAARVPVYTGWVDVERSVHGGRVFLAGDSAGQVKVTTVGGIVTGLRGALGVAEKILDGQSRELRGLRRELNAHLWLRRALHHFTQADYSNLFDSLSAPTRQALGYCSRDDAFSMILRLCWNEPRLAVLGLRGLLMRNGSPLPKRSESERTVMAAVAPGD